MVLLGSIALAPLPHLANLTDGSAAEVGPAAVAVTASSRPLRPRRWWARHGGADDGLLFSASISFLMIFIKLLSGYQRRPDARARGYFMLPKRGHMKETIHSSDSMLSSSGTLRGILDPGRIRPGVGILFPFIARGTRKKKRDQGDRAVGTETSMAPYGGGTLFALPERYATVSSGSILP
jgi:hypothetical protein